MLAASAGSPPCSCRPPAAAARSAAASPAPLRPSQTNAPRQAKSLSPPDAVSCCLVDHANGRLLTALLEQVVSQKEGKLVEKARACRGSWHEGGLGAASERGCEAGRRGQQPALLSVGLLPMA